jgi:hypothetical protein
VRRLAAFGALALLAGTPGCSCGPKLVESNPSEATKAPAPTPANGWAKLVVVPEQGVPMALAFARGADDLWLATPDGRRLRQVSADGTVGPSHRVPDAGAVSSVSARRTDDGTRVTTLDSGRRVLQTATFTADGPGDWITEPVEAARPLGALDVAPDGTITVLDAAQRPVGKGLHPALRGLEIAGNRRVRAGTTNAGPMLFVTGEDGAPRRILLGSIPKAEAVRVLGVDGGGLVWLLAETGAADDRAKHLVRVDLDGRVLERAVPPPIDDSKGAAGTGKGSGRVATAVHSDGRLAWVGPSKDGIEVHIYTPGVPGRGLPQVEVKPPAR